MPKSVKAAVAKTLRPRFRVLRGQDVALGPGKVELLKYVCNTGSIRRAAAQMGMSYMRAWGLIRTMNQCFNRPLVVTVRGGSERGGAKLTPTGKTVLDLYQRMELESLAATEKTWLHLAGLLKENAR